MALEAVVQKVGPERLAELRRQLAAVHGEAVMSGLKDSSVLINARVAGLLKLGEVAPG